MERRTVVKGAAWAMPAVIIASAAPTVAASVTCNPTLSVQPGSFKCCANGPAKTMNLNLLVTDASACGIPVGSNICIVDVRMANGQSINQVVGKGQCARLGETFRVTLLGVSSCSVNLLVDLSVDGALRTVEIKSANIPGGDTDACASI